MAPGATPPAPMVVAVGCDGVRGAHLRCAAWELPMGRHPAADAIVFGDPSVPPLARVAAAAAAREPAAPHCDVALRSVAHATWRVAEAATARVVEEVGGAKAMLGVYPGAIVLRQGAAWRVASLDVESRVAVVERADGTTFTQPRDVTKLRFWRPIASRRLAAASRGDFPACAAAVAAIPPPEPGERWDVALAVPTAELACDAAAAETLAAADGGADEEAAVVSLGSGDVEFRVLGHYVLDARTCGVVERVTTPHLPATRWTATCAWVEVPPSVLLNAPAGVWDRLSFAAGLHSAMHAVVACLPLCAALSPHDIVGHTAVAVPPRGRPVIAVYDAVTGGIPAAALAYGVMADAVARARAVVVACSCEAGCAACVCAPRCGCYNAAIDKAAAALILTALCGGAAPVG